jgi:tetratricopeptide (TPR) repeat protein
MSDLETVESLKTEGNKFFNQKDYKKAEELYTSAIEKSEEPNCILFTNRAAARYELGKYSEAIEDCDRAVFINSSWTKAYFRKSSALDKIPETSRRSKYSVWHQAMKYCDPTPLLHKHYEAAKKSWLPYYKTEAVEDTEDFLERISLLKDSREKLSTMAHL